MSGVQPGIVAVPGGAVLVLLVLVLKDFNIVQRGLGNPPEGQPPQPTKKT